MDHIPTNVLELKSGSTIRNNLTQNDCEHIANFVTINYEGIPDLNYPTGNKTLEFFPKVTRTLFGYLFLTSDTKYMIVTLLMMNGHMLLTTTLMSSTL